MTDKNKLRELALASAPRKRVPVEFNGGEFELLAPNVGQRREMFNKASTKEGMRSFVDLYKWCAIICTVVPGTTERLFEDTDSDAFENMNCGGYLDKVGEHYLELTNTHLETETEKKPGLEGSQKTTSKE